MLECKELISVIVPVYNVEDYLERCIKSIISQSYTDLEIILVDDGSTDTSGNICDNWEKVDSRIHVIHKRNGGLSSARNMAINFATGKYLMFVDSDDYILPGCVQYLYSLICSGADVVVGNYVRTFQDDVRMQREFTPEIIYYTGIEAIQQLFTKKTVQMVTAWAKLYKSSLFKNINYTVGLLHEDEATTYKIYDISNSVIVSNKCVYAYFTNQESISRKPKKKNFEDLEKIFSEQIDYFSRRNEIAIADLVRIRYCINIATHYLPYDFFGDHYEMKKKAKQLFKEITNYKLIGIKACFKGWLCAYCPYIVARITIKDKNY